MEKWKRVLATGCISVLLTTGISMPAIAASQESLQAANHLNELGLFSGTGTNSDGTPIYELDRTPTRQEAVVMLVRLLGKESEAAKGNWDIPFTDVAEWAKPAVGYAYANKLTSGISATQFGSSNPVTASQYISFALRALGYNSNDFQWDKAWELSDKIGLTHGEYTKSTTIFTRGDVAVISDRALTTVKKGSNESLQQSALITKPTTKPNNTSVSVEPISYAALAESVSKQNHAKVATNGSFANFNSYLVKDSSTSNLITVDELKKLKNNTTTMPKSVSYKAAVEDVNLLFRFLHSVYGPYYYFGEQNYNKAEQEVMTWLDGQQTINVLDLENVIVNSLSYMKDGHSSIGTSKVQAHQTKWYRSYLCDMDFGKDTTGYYTIIDNTKWYYNGVDNPNVLLRPTLKENGDIVYSPVQFCTIKDAKNSSILTLKNGTSTKQKTIQWTISKNYKKAAKQNIFTSLTQNDIAYLALRSCPYDTSDPNKIAFEKSGSDVKNAKLILIDLRGNHGGERALALNWFRNYTGEYPQLPEIRAYRKSILTPHNSGATNDYVINYRTSGKFVSNDIPIIILTDTEVASSGEYILQCMRSMDNVMVVGSNTKGAQLGGAKDMYRLPNSKILFKIGTSIEFLYNTNNVDLKGWEPDIWCDPSCVFDAVLNMCEKSNLANEADLTAFRQACEKSGYLF